MPNVKQLPPPVPVLLWDRRYQGVIAEPVVNFDDKLENLVDRLISTCYAHNGLGLAAPQIGEFKRVAVLHFPQEKSAWPIINPVIDDINSKGEQTAHEGCLSIPQGKPIPVRVRRCYKICYSYQDVTGKQIEAEAEGLLARAIAHEVDHLEGLFFTDRIGDVTRMMVMREHQKWLKANPNLVGGRWKR